MKRTKWVVGLTAALGAMGYVACVESSSTSEGPGATSSGSGTGSSGSGSGDFDRKEMLASLAETVVFPTYEAMAEAAAELAEATEAHAASPSEETLTEAQKRWRQAMTVWQRAELMQIGPAAPSDMPGGKDLRDAIYSWPTVNRCAVDREIVKGEYADADAFAKKLINVKGLDALEYLLFHEGADNACAPANDINKDGTWADVEDELPQRRADYAHTVATLVSVDAKTLRDAWDPKKGNFAAELAGPGATYEKSLAVAIGNVVYALNYLDTRTKDLKLATPAGLSDCKSATCPEKLESIYAHHSKASVRENLIAFQRVFHGGASFDADALGFDDWLDAVGAKELSAELASSIAAAIAAVDAIEEDTLAEALADDPESVEDAFQAVQRITTLFKADLVTVLDIELPHNAPTDND